MSGTQTPTFTPPPGIYDSLHCPFIQFQCDPRILWFYHHVGVTFHLNCRSRPAQLALVSAYAFSAVIWQVYWVGFAGPSWQEGFYYSLRRILIEQYCAVLQLTYRFYYLRASLQGFSAGVIDQWDLPSWPIWFRIEARGRVAMIMQNVFGGQSDSWLLIGLFLIIDLLGNAPFWWLLSWTLVGLTIMYKMEPVTES